MQSELNFDDASGEDGHKKWLAGRKLTAGALARRLNLPVGHPVEVCLAGNIVIRGVLRLQEDFLFIEEDTLDALHLKIGKITFGRGEIESCVRLD